MSNARPRQDLGSLAQDGGASSQKPLCLAMDGLWCCSSQCPGQFTWRNQGRRYVRQQILPYTIATLAARPFQPCEKHVDRGDSSCETLIKVDVITRSDGNCHLSTIDPRTLLRLQPRALV